MIWLLAYIACIVGANLAQVTFGMVPVGFGLMGTAGIYGAGLAFTARDMVQERLGRAASLLAIVAGGLLSAIISPSLAVASFTAFLLSEFLDFMVYNELRERRWIAAVIISNIAGAVLDSMLFVYLAFGTLDHWQGQALGKVEMTLAVVPFLWWYRRKP